MDSISRNSKDSEYKLVLSLLESQWDSSVRSNVIKLLKDKKIDWELFIQITNSEEIGPLLYSIIKNYEGVSQKIIKVLESKYSANKARNIILYDELLPGIDGLFKKDIPFILLKGVSLIGDVYQDYASRTMRDIDLLLHKRDVIKAVKVFQDLGFEFISFEKKIETYLEYENELLLVKHGYIDVMIELHWSLINSKKKKKKIDMVWFWQRTREMMLFGIYCQKLSLEAQILYLSAHLALHHRGNGLLWLNDIAIIVDKYRADLDWEMLLSHAEKYSLILPLQDVVRNLEKLLHVRFPEQFIKKLFLLNATIEERENYYFLSSEKSVGEHLLYDLKNINGVNRKIRFLVRNIFPSFFYMKMRYQLTSFFLVPFFYPYRWYLGIKSLVVHDSRKSKKGVYRA